VAASSTVLFDLFRSIRWIQYPNPLSLCHAELNTSSDVVCRFATYLRGAEVISTIQLVVQCIEGL
jgi:hypothetical protein